MKTSGIEEIDTTYARKLISQDLVALIVIGLFGICVFSSFHSETFEAEAMNYLIAASCFPAIAGIGIHKSKFIIFNRTDLLIKLELGHAITRALFLVSGAFFGGLPGLFIGLLLTNLTQNAIFTFGSSALFGKSRASNNMKPVRGQIVGLAAVARSASKQSLTEADIVLLSMNASASDIVTYKVCKSIAQIGAAIQIPIWRILHPIFYKETKRPTGAFAKKAFLGSAIGFVVSLIIVAVLSQLPDKLFQFIYDKSITGVGTIGAMLVVAKTLLSSVIGWYKPWATATGNYILAITPYLVALVSMIVLNQILAPESIFNFTVILIISYFILLCSASFVVRLAR